MRYIVEAEDEGCFLVMQGDDIVAVCNTYREAHAFIQAEG